MLRALAVLALILSLNRSALVDSHEESGEWSCNSNSEIRVQVQYRPGVITLDGRVDDWKDIAGSEFSLLPALDPDDDKEYNAGEMIVKAAHDGKDIFFMLQVGGKYAYVKGENRKCPSVALMFQVGEHASYHRMGGCGEAPDKCSNKTCHGHEVDIMHFSIGNAIPGRLYGGNLIDNGVGNGGDRYGHLLDEYAWSPHCLYLDGLGPSGNYTGAQNDWRGAWWHSSLSGHAGYVEEDSPYTSESDDESGTYYFEFSRPLRTMDRLQQDVQFTIGETSKGSVAFWYPTDGKPWHASGHYSINCDWVSLDIVPGAVVQGSQRSTFNAGTVFSLFFSIVAFCMAIFIGHRETGQKTIPFTPVENL